MAATVVARASLVALALTCSASIGHSEDMSASPRFAPAQSRGPVPALPECTCRAKGAEFALGARVCLEGTNGSQLFRCALDLNVTSWQAVGEPCPQS